MSKTPLEKAISYSRNYDRRLAAGTLVRLLYCIEVSVVLDVQRRNLNVVVVQDITTNSDAFSLIPYPSLMCVNERTIDGWSRSTVSSSTRIVLHSCLSADSADASRILVKSADARRRGGTLYLYLHRVGQYSSQYCIYSPAEQVF